MTLRWTLCRAALLLLPMARPVNAQHAGHDVASAPDSSARTAHVMAQLIPLVTRATPSAGGVTHTQWALTQALVMARWSLLGGHLGVDVALNGEGFTMPDGELNTGAFGEGFVDRRHPHTYVHELMLGGRRAVGPVELSISGGRGFAPFGTDDPMMRPMVKYPINHHLSQILERAALIVAARHRGVIIEASTFGGDEPVSASSLPRADRFGDSWSVRSTLLPVQGMELQASYARVTSPEEPDGHGLNQRKQSLSARGATHDGGRYLLAEWARTVEHDHSRKVDVFSFQSALVEASARVAGGTIALRLEQTDRPEEDRLDDPFRTPQPHIDLNINGITRWRTVTLQLAAPSVTRGVFYGFPFIEVARLGAHARQANSFFTPERLYGTSRFWMATVGVRLLAGSTHSRMGRYGVALPATH